MSEQEEADWKRRQEEAASVGDDDNNFGGYDNSGRVHSRRAQQPLLLIEVMLMHVAAGRSVPLQHCIAGNEHLKLLSIPASNRHPRMMHAHSLTASISRTNASHANQVAMDSQLE